MRMRMSVFGALNLHCPGPLVVSFLMPTCASCDALPDVLCGSDPFPDPAGGYNPCSNQRMRCPAQVTYSTPQHPTQNTRAVYLWRSLSLIRCSSHSESCADSTAGATTDEITKPRGNGAIWCGLLMLGPFARQSVQLARTRSSCY